MNKTFLSGNLTRDPVLKTTAGGMQVLELGMAVNERHRNNQTGKWEDRSNYFDLRMFGNRAEKVADMMRKGAKIAVEGHLRYEAWQDRATGQNRSKVLIVIDDFELFSSKNDENRADFSQKPLENEKLTEFDDSIPF